MSVEQEPTARPRRRRDAAATRQDLLQAARRLMNERGVQGTSTRDVAAAAGVNQGLVYRYFGSKEKLFAEAVGGIDVDDSRSVFSSAPLSELPRLLLDNLLDGTDAEGRQNDHISNVLGGAHDDAVRAVVRTHIEQLYGEQLARRLTGPDRQLRAELFAAVMVGIGLLRDKIGTSALAGADRDDLRRHVDALAAVLLDDTTG